LIKTNARGDTLWTRNYGGAGDDEGFSVQQTSDGGYIVVGGANSFGNGSYDVYLIKTNASGDTLWTRTFGGGGDDVGYSVQQTTDGGYIVSGWTNSFGNGSYDVYLIKVDASGDTLWTKTYGGASNDYGRSVQQTRDGGYIVAGMTDSYGHGGYDVYLIKTNTSGDTLWTKTYGGANGDYAFSVRQTQDGGYIVAGSTTSFGNGYLDVYLIKTNGRGDTLWTKTYGGTNGDGGYSVQQTQDRGFIIAGATNSFENSFQVYLIKTNAHGDTLWTRTYGGADFDWGLSVQQTRDGGFIIAGYTDTNENGYQVYLIKTEENGSSGVEHNSSSRIPPYASHLKGSPNPFTSFASVPGHSSERFALYDISGRKVGVYKGDRIGEGLSAGVYFLRPEGKDAKPLRVVKVR
jgi:hypothetical protein